MGAHATDDTRMGELGLCFYVVSHLVIFGRRHGAPRVTNAGLLQRSASIADGQLQSVWEALVVECGVRDGATTGATE
eukprot:6914720-Prymnesium_polylepis.1